ncbi:subtilisin-like protease SBT5.3 [Selaginella moellendorffii]|uniref:subtilisin-like protease SBT5.3 n=1 Tax=Selaginella moellendorffii TaxID=88036 RepID=UPI000D1CD213|nr:subtilisin-like protease SBT5.3 [Selaginella moellendorffii]|eukprot:XP_024539163.1 subtilisin-like protease SBT5.3 [Selaginella moellendorffii]
MPIDRAARSRAHLRGEGGFVAAEADACVLELGPDYPGVVRINPSRTYKLLTTRSWDYMGVSGDKSKHPFIPSNHSLWDQGKHGKDVIVGLIDSGIWPESESFRDHGMNKAPKRWKGTCQPGQLFNTSNCNRKLIGARYYYKGYLDTIDNSTQFLTLSARDETGHGTHTASTAVGRYVKDVSINGLARGTAAGGAPKARLAVYKVCWGNENQCSGADIVAGIDDAVADGVDILSMSLGGGDEEFYDETAQAALYAIAKGVVVVAAAGNTDFTSIHNTAPWFITVGASSIDRDNTGRVSLANGKTFKGRTLTAHGTRKFCPIVSSAQVKAENSTSADSLLCKEGTLDPMKTKGKIVLCMRGGGIPRVNKGAEVLAAGGSGMILYEDPSQEMELEEDPHVVPAVHTTSGCSIFISRSKHGIPFSDQAYMSPGFVNATPFDYGAGHLNPYAAAHPGLVYDLDPKEYVERFRICGIVGYCDTFSAVSELNYPSISVPELFESYTVKRTVTNVGDHRSIYRVSVEAPPGIAVTVTPSVLEFTRKRQTKSFEVRFELERKVRTPDLHVHGFIFGSMTWKDHRHTVRSPIAVSYGVKFETPP